MSDDLDTQPPVLRLTEGVLLFFEPAPYGSPDMKLTIALAGVRWATVLISPDMRRRLIRFFGGNTP
jgi:hypothetical protein